MTFRATLPITLALVFTGCGPRFSATEYTGGAIGIIESRNGIGGGPTAYGPDGKPYVGQVPTRSGMISVPGPVAPTYFQYEIREKNGALHLVQDDREFQVGSCVEFTGSADGPSRTHWSRGRVSMVQSDKCGK